MRQDEVYKLLEEYPQYTEKIVSLNHEMHGLMRAMAENCNQMSIQRGEISGMPKSNNISDPVYQAYMETEKLTNEYQNQISHIAMEILDIINNKVKLDYALSQLSQVERNILEMRCIKRYGWNQIAQKTVYSDRQCRSIKDRAIVTIMGLMC